MTWLAGILVVLALGAVAVVAAGRGGPLAPAGDDDPATGLPEEGALDAADLRRVRFPLALRGYRMADVDALLDRLARERDADPADAADPADTADPADVADVADHGDHGGGRDPGA